MRRLCDCRTPLRAASVAATERSDPAVAFRQRSGPFDRIVTVVALVLPRYPLTFRREAAARILPHDDIPRTRRIDGFEAQCHSDVFVIRGALDQDREMALAVR